jgi:drug/metabolite transporter (DMT)-like permease
MMSMTDRFSKNYYHKIIQKEDTIMIQGWVLIALVSAAGDALRDLSAKRILTKGNSLLFTWLIFALPLPAIYTADYFFGGPRPSPGFYGALLTALPLEILAQILYMQALRLSPLSLVAPLLALSPVFMLVVPFLLIGERINPIAGTGVLLIASGAYILNAGAVKKGVLEPFRALLREQGAVYMCMVALLFSFTATLSKKAIMLSSPLHYMAFYWTGIVVGMAPLLFFTYRGKWQGTLADGTIRKALLPALIFVTAVFAAAYAMSITKVTYVTSVKRLSVLFSILLAGAVLKEESIRERFAGGAIMVTGFALIVLYG